MSLVDLGKNDISEETQSLKDRLASRDTENAGLRTQLMRREAELEELQATLNETVYKLSREAERALQLEGEVSLRSSELKTEQLSLRNTELALQSAQERLKIEERAKKELESTLDTVSLHSQATSAEHQSVQRDKRALESRVRELEHIVQMHEAKAASNVSRGGGRPRSSSVSNFRLPAVEQELNDTKAQLHTKDMNLRILEQKLAQAQDNLVKTENACISIDKAGQKRISELLSILEKKEEELELLRETDNTGEREEELLKRIDEDTAKITALEKLVAEGQGARSGQARIQKLQSQLKMECERVHRSEDLNNRLLHEKEELVRRHEASRREVEEGQKSLAARDYQIKELEIRLDQLLAELKTHRDREESLPLRADHTSSQFQGPNGIRDLPDESALADHIQTLLQAVDRLRGERDELKRALEFSEVEYRITAEGFQTRIASLTRQLTEGAIGTAMDRFPANASEEQKMKQLTLCTAAFATVISNIQTQLDLSEDRLLAMSTELTSSNSRLHDALAVVENQKQLLDSTTTKEFFSSGEECGRLRLQSVATMIENARASETAKEEAQQSSFSIEQQFVTLIKNYQDVESERNSLALQITNLQDDLVCVQNQLSDTQHRYNALHAQQFSVMSTSDVVQALKDRIQELEAHLVQRTDQIGDYQHDIGRLEANVKLHEERLAEMTSELELFASQKEAMVEDCAEAREARDKAVERLEVAEEEAERLQQQLWQAKHAHETERSAMSSMIANLTSEGQQATAHLAIIEAENARFSHQLDTLSCDHQRLIEELNTSASRLRSLELEISRENAEMQQAVISLAVIYRVYKDSARRHQKSHQRITSLESQLVTLTQELEQTKSHADDAEREKQSLLQRLSDISTATDASQEDIAISPFCLQTTVEELSSTCTRSQDIKHDRDVDSSQISLQDKEPELVAAKQLLEQTKFRCADVETELPERIVIMTTAQAGQADNIANLQMELGDVRMQLQNSLQNFADLEKLHDDVIQEFTTTKEVFERRLSETDAQLCSLNTDHQRSLEAMEARYRRETDILSSNLEEREHEVDELHKQLQDISEAHACAEEKLREELRSHEAHHTHMNDLEKHLRRAATDIRQQLAQSEAEALALQEERQLLQAQITGLQAEIQRSTSLTRYLESQVRESEDACMLMKESLQRTELTLAESEKAGKAAEFNLTLQITQHEKVAAALRREIVSLQSGPELRSAFDDLEERNREMDDLLRAKCQEIEEYDDRILETLKANKKLTSKVESLTRKIQALQAKVSSIKTQPRQTETDVDSLKMVSSAHIVSAPAATPVGSHLDSSRIQESSGPSLNLRSKTPESQLQSVFALPSSHAPNRADKPLGCEASAGKGKKRPAPDDDERDGVPAEGHYSADACARNGPTPRLRRAHGHPASFTPVRGASLRKPGGLSSPGSRPNGGVTPSEVITDVTNSPRGSSGQGSAQLKKRGWLGRVRSGTGSRTGAC